MWSITQHVRTYRNTSWWTNIYYSRAHTCSLFDPLLSIEDQISKGSKSDQMCSTMEQKGEQIFALLREQIFDQHWFLLIWINIEASLIKSGISKADQTSNKHRLTSLQFHSLILLPIHPFPLPINRTKAVVLTWFRRIRPALKWWDKQHQSSGACNEASKYLITHLIKQCPHIGFVLHSPSPALTHLYTNTRKFDTSNYCRSDWSYKPDSYNETEEIWYCSACSKW